MNSILICDDEKDILDMLSMFFRNRGYRIMTARNGQEVFAQIEKQPDIILLDINMPGPDGIDVCRRIRNIVPCPIIFLTARVDEADKINGFAAGGDDYVVKPFSPAELEARVSAHIRRESRARTGSKIRFSDDLIIDYSERTIAAGDSIIKLPRKEFDIVALLLIWNVISVASALNGMYAYDGVSEEGRGFEAVKMEKKIAAEYEGLLTDKKVRQIINDFPADNFIEGLDAKYAYNNSIQSAVYSHFVDKDGNYNGKTVKEIYGSNRIKIGYINGWNYTVRVMIQVFFALMIVIMLIISPVFSGDYGSMSSIVMSSRYGRSKNASARIIAAFAISFALAFIAAVFNIAAALVIYGTDGLDCSVLFASVDFEGGLVPHNITCLR